MTMPAQRPGSSRQDYQTPPEFLTAVQLRFGITKFAIDLAATPDTAVADRFLTRAEDALTVRWPATGIGWAWLNPPFAHLAPWAAKARHSTSRSKPCRTLMLVPASTGANWWRDHVHGHAQILLLNGRLTFVGESAPYPKDCALLIYNGPNCGVSYEIWDWRHYWRHLR